MIPPGLFLFTLIRFCLCLYEPVGLADFCAFYCLDYTSNTDPYRYWDVTDKKINTDYCTPEVDVRLVSIKKCVLFTATT
jgi:hypothetical protein